MYHLQFNTERCSVAILGLYNASILCVPYVSCKITYTYCSFVCLGGSSVFLLTIVVWYHIDRTLFYVFLRTNVIVCFTIYRATITNMCTLYFHFLPFYFLFSISTNYITALELFYELKNYRQAAAAHYQLGSFYSNYWPLCPSRSDALLEKALLHYRESHGYYSKYDVGPTLLLILVDMCDLYLGAYTATEPYLISSIRGKEKEKEKEREKVKGKEKSSDVHIESECNTSTQTPRHLSGDTTDTLSHVHVPPTTNANTMSDSISASMSDCKSSIESDSDLVVALLGGALQSLLESRFAFTPAVAERSRYRSQIISLAGEIAKRLGGVLVRVLKAHAKGHLPWPKTPTTATDSKVANTDSPCDEKGANLAMESQNTNLQSATLADLTGSGSVIHNGYRPNVKVNPNDTVLEVRRICVELLRWSVPSHTTPLSTPSPSSSPSLSTISVPLSPSSPLPSSTHYSIGADVISVARLYELIDILNQNEWLRSCCSSSAK